MRNGEPTCKKRFGPFLLNLDDLTQISFPRDGGKAVTLLTEDIRVNGMKDPLEINLLLEETLWHQLRIFQGNQRIQALRNLGIKQAPCYLTIEGYPDNEGLGKTIKSLFLSIPTITQTL